MIYHVRLNEGSTLLKNFQDTMIKVIDNRFKNHCKIDETNKDLILAAISTPRLKTSFVRDDFDYNIARNLLISECLILSSQKEQRSVEDASEEVNDEDFFISYTPRLMRRNSVEQSIEAEVEKYLMDDRKQIEMLNEYTHVKLVYYKYNTTLCSSAAIERVFSQSALIFTPRRNRILASNFEYVLLLKYNRQLLD